MEFLRDNKQEFAVAEFTWLLSQKNKEKKR